MIIKLVKTLKKARLKENLHINIATTRPNTNGETNKKIKYTKKKNKTFY